MNTLDALPPSGNQQQRSIARPAVPRGRALRMLAVALLAGVAAGLLHPAPRTVYAKPKHVKVRVYDQNRRPVADENVYVYRANEPSGKRCFCATTEECALVMVPAWDTNNGGLAKIEGLDSNTQYEVCVNPRCEIEKKPCENPQHCCEFEGICDDVTTNEQGGSSRTVELQKK